MSDGDSGYELGSGDDELARLELQGRALAPATRMIFTEAGIISTIAPLIERTGVATAEQIGVDTFAQRLQADLDTTSAVVAHPILLSAWATTGEA